jgi:hypothetical protein
MMATELQRTVIDAIISLLRTIELDGEPLPVGDGEDPNHEYPFIVVRQISMLNVEGPPTDTDADSQIRIQVSGAGGTREQADFARDLVRPLLTRNTLDEWFAVQDVPRAVITLTLDMSRTDRFDRGTAAPIFNAVDQYLIGTTPRPVVAS